VVEWKRKEVITTKRLILAALLLGLLLAPMEMFGLLRKSAEQAGEIVSSPEARVLIMKVKAELPNLGARVSKLVDDLLPPMLEEEEAR